MIFSYFTRYLRLEKSFVCVFGEFLTCNILLHAKAMQKLIRKRKDIKTQIIYKSLIKTMF